jgi:hypothetical protein
MLALLKEEWRYITIHMTVFIVAMMLTYLYAYRARYIQRTLSLVPIHGPDYDPGFLIDTRFIQTKIDSFGYLHSRADPMHHQTCRASSLPPGPEPNGSYPTK